MKTLATIFLSALQTLAFSQATISGQVTDAAGNAVPLANVYLLDTYDGTSADDQGKFSFTTNETGTQVLVAKFIGYREFRQPLTLSGKDITLEVRLQEEVSELNAVTISAGAFTASDESRRTVFRAVDIATTAGATADIAGALNTLPGTQKVGESGRLFVRGGDSNEARTFIDGMLVLDAYSPAAPNTPSRGRFLPFMFKGTSFSTGGYSAEYGQALSSALALDSKDESEITRTDIGILSVGGDLTHTQAWEGGSAAAKVQYTNLRPYMGLINQEIDWKTPPASVQGMGAFRQRVGKQGMVKAYGNFSHSDFSLYNHDIDNYNNKAQYDLANDYRYLNGFYKTALNDNWMVRGGLSYTYMNNDVTLMQDNTRETEKGVHAKAVAEGSLSDQVELRTGVEVINRSYEQVMLPFGGTGTSLGFDETITAAFAETDVYASNKFVTRLGARVEHNNLTDKLSVDPRASLSYKAGSTGQVSLAYGRFRQSPKNQYLQYLNTLGPEQAQHFILNYQRVENNRTFRIETYYKKYENLVKTVDAQLTNLGSGYARGVELFLRDNESVDKLDYWISYSYLDTKRDYLDFPVKAVPTFASKHNFSIVAKYFVQKLKSQLGATYSYASGRPYNDPNSAVFNGGKTPDYQDLSFNWSYLPKPYLIVYLSCTNLPGRNNIFGYEYSTQMNEQGVYNGRPIRQPAPRFLFIGIFITLSKNKSVNQLPTL
ncbi:carboxypeptidase-like regulatory domain-containing protein [Fulvivirgaceae bacterium PWU4]|uniref:Carboxypeptidase-like regulatory domain-containing protein n=1 Tax=Chryseosolibacter histidini TaxID=2782349 RepID=A0AAP2DIF1_9BACT|nr:TonB-dependent receptor [Chryseosolibacter histidini]MBT1695777.1 carboxypeptidase-like regulatory domain-containing protein [Chryseosolibacter histidini]